MPRPPRVVEPGGIYHATPRGNDGRGTFAGDADRRQFLSRLDRVARRYSWVVNAYAVLTNHVHLLVQVPECGLSEGMRDLLGGYAHWWNLEHGHYGHLFHNRFKAQPVLSDRHLLATARYIDLNPVRAGIVKRPEEWTWSSYRAHAGYEHPPRFLASRELLELFGPTPALARRAYRRFVSEGHVPVSDTGFRRPGPGAGASERRLIDGR